MSKVQMPPWDPPTVTNDSDCRLLPPTTQTELEVITAIQNLGNTVIANAASRSLTKYVLTSMLSKNIHR
jgi:large subunit ribosomal protein L17e